MSQPTPAPAGERGNPTGSAATQSVRGRVISVLLLIATLVSFVVAWPARDHELVVRLDRVSEAEPAELYIDKLFCTLLTDCFRAAHKVALTGIRLVTDGAISLLYALPGSTVTDVPEWAPGFVRNLGPYLVLRALVLVAIALALLSYLRRWWAVAVAANVLLWWSTGAPIRAVVRLYGNLAGALGDKALGPVLDYHFSMNSTIFLLEYDYIALALLLFFPIWLQRNDVHRGTWRPIVMGLLLGMTFEHLAIVYVVALVWLAWRGRLTGWLRPALLVTLGWAVYIVAMIIHARVTVPGSEERIVSITQLGFRINREGNHEWIILRFVFGFLGIPYVLGLVVGMVSRRLGLLRAAVSNLRPYIHAVVIGLSLSYLVGFFHSALITEFGRQTIGAQALLFISGVLYFAPATISTDDRTVAAR